MEHQISCSEPYQNNKCTNENKGKIIVNDNELCINNKLAIQGPFKMKSTICPLDRTEDRGNHFSERKSHWALPIHETHYVESIGTGPGNNEYIVCINFITLYRRPYTC